MNSNTNLLNKSSEQLSQTDLRKILQQIVGEVQIEPDFRVTHLQSGTFFLQERIEEKFQQLSPQVQQQYLCVQLQTLLHDIYYHQSKVNILDEPEEDAIENQAIKWRKRKFYHQLKQNNFGQGYFDAGWLVTNEEKENLLPVKKNDLTLHISPLRHLQPKDRQAKVGELVAVKMPANIVEPGFYIAVGDAGVINYQESIEFSDRQVVNIYFHLTAEGAVAIMSSITQQLNQLKIPFNFKALYNADDYPSEDAATLSIERQHYQLVSPILQEIYVTNSAYFLPEIPLFTKLLAPGLSLAEEPIVKTSSVETFKLHRFQPIAQGLMTAWQQGDDSVQGKVNLILEYFVQRQINLKHPYLNADSEDMYLF
jgi:hypothetical protein